MSAHPSVGRVTTVRHTLKRAGKNVGHFNSDLIFVDQVPTIVIEWTIRPDGDLPAVTVPLDPAHLRKLDWPEAEYAYVLAVEDPRRFD